MEIVNLKEKFKKITEYWTPGVVGELNGQVIKLAKLKGEFVRHFHKDQDEMFMVVKGSLIIETDTESHTLEEGELLVIPRGIHHKPVAPEEVWIMLFEPEATLNTGNVENERTITTVEKL